MVGDFFTKPLQGDKFRKFRELILGIKIRVLVAAVRRSQRGCQCGISKLRWGWNFLTFPHVTQPICFESRQNLTCSIASTCAIDRYKNERRRPGGCRVITPSCCGCINLSPPDVLLKLKRFDQKSIVSN